MTDGAIRRLRPPAGYDLAGTVRALALLPGDPTIAIDARQAWWATRTPDGPGSLHLYRDGEELLAAGYGPGTPWLLDHADAIAGLCDELGDFPTRARGHPVVARLAKVHSGLRMPATGRLAHHLVPAILGQKVTRVEAQQGYHRLVHRLSQPAPGPHPRLRLPPDPQVLAATPYWALHPMGIERRRADTIARSAAYATKLESAPDPKEATRRLTVLPGIGPWTAAEVVRVTYGDPDAVTVGDLHLPSIVSYALAGEPRGDDARMLELLAPFAGHRARVCRLLHAGRVPLPRYGPHAPIRSFHRY